MGAACLAGDAAHIRLDAVGRPQTFRETKKDRTYTLVADADRPCGTFAAFLGRGPVTGATPRPLRLRPPRPARTP